jgi:hypothetical protein
MIFKSGKFPLALECGAVLLREEEPGFGTDLKSTREHIKVKVEYDKIVLRATVSSWAER